MSNVLCRDSKQLGRNVLFISYSPQDSKQLRSHVVQLVLCSKSGHRIHNKKITYRIEYETLEQNRKHSWFHCKLIFPSGMQPVQRELFAG